jgi:hypothetical protein
MKIKERKQMLNEELVVISRIQKYLKESYQNVADAMIGGGIDNMEKYKYMLGQAQAYLIISQEISNLLEPKEQKNENKERDETNVIDFGNPEN